jgi:hypothetical protein
MAQNKNIKRIVFLNAIALNMVPKRAYGIYVESVSLRDVVEFVNRHSGVEVVHYIRHLSTLSLLRRYIPRLGEQQNAGLYQWQEGDVIFVVTLKTPQRGTEVQQVTEEDIAVYHVTIT